MMIERTDRIKDNYTPEEVTLDTIEIVTNPSQLAINSIDTEILEIKNVLNDTTITSLRKIGTIQDMLAEQNPSNGMAYFIIEE